MMGHKITGKNRIIATSLSVSLLAMAGEALASGTREKLPSDFQEDSRRSTASTSNTPAAQRSEEDAEAERAIQACRAELAKPAPNEEGIVYNWMNLKRSLKGDANKLQSETNLLRPQILAYLSKQLIGRGTTGVFLDLFWNETGHEQANQAILGPALLVRFQRDPSFEWAKQLWRSVGETQEKFRALLLDALHTPDSPIVRKVGLMTLIDFFWKQSGADQEVSRDAVRDVLLETAQSPIRSSRRNEAIEYLWNAGGTQQAENRRVLVETLHRIMQDPEDGFRSKAQAFLDSVESQAAASS